MKLFKSWNFLYLLILLFTFSVHLSYIPNGFTWLDHGDIERGRAVLPLDKIPSAFVTRFGDTGFYRPVVTVANSLDAFIYQTFPPGYHMTNLLLHVGITAILPFFLVAFFSVKQKHALLAALFFGIHPLSFLPVGAISYRPELLMTLFVLLTIFLYIRARETNSFKFKIAAAFSFFLALGAKETALFLVPASIAVWEYVFFRHAELVSASHKIPKRVRDDSHKQLVLLFLITIIVYIAFRMYAIPELWRADALPLSFLEAIGTRLFIVGKLLPSLITPLIPSLSDTVPILSIFHPVPLLVIFVLISTFYISLRASSFQFRASILLFLLYLAPALSIIPVPRLGSPHYAYIALVPSSILIVLCATLLISRFSNLKPVVYAICFIWVLWASTQTFLAGFRFTNDLTLFKPEITNDTHFTEAYFYLGNYYLGSKKYKTAEQMYHAALQSQQGFHSYVEPISVMTNLAAAYYAQNNYQKADATLEEALRIAPNEQKPFLLYNRALLAYKQKNYQKVVDLLSKNHDNNQLAILLLAEAKEMLKKSTSLP